jgi:hypothetical protein
LQGGSSIEGDASIAEEPQMLEMGAGILYTGNQYLYNISLELGLHHVPSPRRTFAFFDGNRFAFQSGTYSYSHKPAV